MSGSYNELGTVPFDDSLVAGTEIAALTAKVTILTTLTLARGSVLGIVTASGKAILCATGAGDGSEIPKYILPEDVDTTAGDEEFAVYKTGVFFREKLVVGAGVIGDYEDNLRKYNIQLRDEV